MYCESCAALVCLNPSVKVNSACIDFVEGQRGLLVLGFQCWPLQTSSSILLM